MKTDNKDSEKDLNANPDSSLNTNRTTGEHDRFPESRQARDEMELQRRREEMAAREKKEKDNSNIESLADDVAGTVGDRTTGSNPRDIAGVSDIDRGMRRGRRKP